MRFIGLLTLIFFLASNCFAIDTTRLIPSISKWNLPIDLNDKNTKISFEVDSTWHVVRGVTSGIEGLMKLQDEKDPASVEVRLQVPVASFDTDNLTRNGHMRDAMSAERFPTVSFLGSGLQKLCTPALVLRDGSCNDVLLGKLTLLETTRSIELPIEIIRISNQSFSVKGKVPLRWAEYGVEDPSIFISRLDPTVTVYFEITL